ncbi:MAG: GNAT family N-acetyltransferase [Erysipelotrichaceae bacterium]|nr:GNAT family N-acetyltransferase [Erysipelotrichaceae bacterium]
MDVFLRLEVKEQDAVKMIGWLQNQNITKYLNEDVNSPYLLQKIIDDKRTDFLTYYLNQDGRFFLIDNEQGSIGFINLFTIIAKKEYEVVIAIGDEINWGKKYAKKALEKIVKEVFYNWRINRLNAKIHVDNHRSINLFEHLGFVKSKTDNDYHYYSLNERTVFSNIYH